MKVFLTGGTGFIGSAIVPQLIQGGHQVLGLARSDAAAKSLTAAGAEVHRGNLEDLDSLRSGAAASEAVLHIGFNHDFAHFKAVCEADRRAIEALGSELAGSSRPLIVTSGAALVAQGQLATEDSASTVTSADHPRAASEEAAAAVAAKGVRISVVRLAVVHGDGDPHFIPNLIRLAREKGVSAYVGDGLNCWPAVHRLDAAQLYRLALEKGSAGARYHAVAEEGVPLREIAEAIGRGLKLPTVSKSREEAAAHFGGFAMFAGMDGRASSKLTRARLGWQPVQSSLLADLDRGNYFKTALVAPAPVPATTMTGATR